MRALYLLAGSTLAAALPQRKPWPATDSVQELSLRNEVPYHADTIRMNSKKDPKTKACLEACHKTNAACSAGCMQNVLALNLGNIAPCLASCGTAVAACKNAVST